MFVVTEKDASSWQLFFKLFKFEPPLFVVLARMLARAQVPVLRAVLYGQEAGFVSEKQGPVLKACKPHWKRTVSEAPLFRSTLCFRLVSPPTTSHKT